MANSHVSPAALTEAEYPLVWGTFAAHWPERDRFVGWFMKVMVPFFIQWSRFTGKKVLRVLSVGAGPGLFDLELIKAIRIGTGGRLRVDVTFLEPNPAHFDMLLLNIAGIADDGVVCHPLKKTWDEFEGLGPFDWIFLSHVFYYLFDRVAVLERCRDMLSPEGVGIIFNQPPPGQHLIQQRFLARAYGNDDRMVSTSQLADILRHDLGVARRHILLPMPLDVAPVLRPDNPLGKAFLGLTLEIWPDRLHAIDPDFLPEVRGYIESISVPGRTGRFMEQPAGAVVFGAEDLLQAIHE